MSIEKVRAYLKEWDRAGDIMEFEAPTATVEQAAGAVGVMPARIAKSMSLFYGDGVMILVTAGDTKIDNKKFKEQFKQKAKMLSRDEAALYTGHVVGGVCPFALPVGVVVFLDQSLKRFETVFPACGSANSAIELTIDELFKYSNAESFVDVCKEITEN